MWQCLTKFGKCILHTSNKHSIIWLPHATTNPACFFPWISFQITFFFSFSRLFLCILQGLSQEVLASWVGWGTHFCEIRASWSFPVSVWNVSQIIHLEWGITTTSWLPDMSSTRHSGLSPTKCTQKTVINGVNQQHLTSRVLLPQLPNSFGHFLGVNQQKTMYNWFFGATYSIGATGGGELGLWGTLSHDGSMGRRVNLPTWKPTKINHSCRWIYLLSHGSVMGIDPLIP